MPDLLLDPLGAGQDISNLSFELSHVHSRRTSGLHEGDMSADITLPGLASDAAIGDGPLPDQGSLHLKHLLEAGDDTIDAGMLDQLLDFEFNEAGEMISRLRPQSAPSNSRGAPTGRASQTLSEHSIAGDRRQLSAQNDGAFGVSSFMYQVTDPVLRHDRGRSAGDSP